VLIIICLHLVWHEKEFDRLIICLHFVWHKMIFQNLYRSYVGVKKFIEDLASCTLVVAHFSIVIPFTCLWCCHQITCQGPCGILCVFMSLPCVWTRYSLPYIRYLATPRGRCVNILGYLCQIKYDYVTFSVSLCAHERERETLSFYGYEILL
jgi:hypothetical protein